MSSPAHRDRRAPFSPRTGGASLAVARASPARSTAPRFRHGARFRRLTAVLLPPKLFLGVFLDQWAIPDEAGKGPGNTFTGAFIGMAAHDTSGRGMQAGFLHFQYKPRWWRA
ncbi:MAG: hypothetical protein EP318_13330 [Rhodobacteraceae bacterium]|nr:MAG: hypothetical protein EP318_13330 [Paracoccaceae bacterium]